MGSEPPKEKIPGLNPNQIDFMKVAEHKNLKRALRLQKTRRNNIITGSLLGVGVFGIYFYSMFAVKQERFLDDFDEPEKVNASS